MELFCVAKIHCDPRLRGDHGVITGSAWHLTNDAQVVADQLLDDARKEADALVRQAQAEAAEIVRQAEQRTLEQAMQLMRALEKANASLLERSQDIVVSLAQGLFDRLVLDTTPRERIEATLRRVLQEAQVNGLNNPLLRLHPDDITLAPPIEWEVRPDPTLERGTCRLESSGGLWQADFCAAVSSLKSALERSATGTGSSRAF